MASFAILIIGKDAEGVRRREYLKEDCDARKVARFPTRDVANHIVPHLIARRHHTLADWQEIHGAVVIELDQ